jgi:hypothetical protein
MKPDYRIFGTFGPMRPEAMEELKHELPFEVVNFDGRTLDFEHESGWLDVEPVLEEIADAMAEGGSGGLDFIDNPAWEITRYKIEDGVITSKTLPLNAVLDGLQVN